MFTLWRLALVVSLSFGATNSSLCRLFGMVTLDSGGKIIASQSATGKDTGFGYGYIFNGTYYAAVYTPSYCHNDGEYGLTVVPVL